MAKKHPKRQFSTQEREGRWYWRVIGDLASAGRLGGILLVLGTVLSLILANFILGEPYVAIWKKEFHLGPVHLTLEHIVNEGLMAIFFLVAGMEIKRELKVGALKTVKSALLPVIGALGGVLAPAAIYSILNWGTPAMKGWAIPTATDIAFSIAVLSLLGEKIPLGLKAFLTALAVADDLSAIGVIAFFFSQGLNLSYLWLALGTTLALVVFSRTQVKALGIYLLFGGILWFFLLKAGVHATVAGVVTGFCIPLGTGGRLTHRIEGPVNYLILPVFALVNTAILLSADSIPALSSMPSMGVFLGLLLGKPLGILLISYVGVKAGFIKMPEGVDWRWMAGAGAAAGIGFTMAIFLASLTFEDPMMLGAVKIATLLASLLSAIGGYLLLRWRAGQRG